MIPVYSSVPVKARFADRVSILSAPLLDYETAGPEIGVASPSSAYEWTAQLFGNDVRVFRDGVAPVTVMTQAGITRVALAFDVAMRPHIAYDIAGECRFRYWDTITNAYETMVLTGARDVRAFSDEKDPLFSSDRDLVISYIRDGVLRSRIQRDRYLVEYNGPSGLGPSTRLVAAGMGDNRRVHWRVAP